MTETEWNQSHPEQCDQYIKAWQKKQEREEYRTASIQHIVAVSGGVKINNRNARLDDFMPSLKRKKINPKLAQARQEVALRQMKAANDRKLVIENL